VEPLSRRWLKTGATLILCLLSRPAFAEPDLKLTPPSDWVRRDRAGAIAEDLHRARELLQHHSADFQNSFHVGEAVVELDEAIAAFGKSAHFEAYAAPIYSWGYREDEINRVRLARDKVQEALVAFSEISSDPNFSSSKTVLTYKFNEIISALNLAVDEIDNGR